MKALITVCVMAGLGTGGYFLWKNSSSRVSNQSDASRPTTAVIEARNIQFGVNAAGDIGPADQVSVRPEVNGRIAELPVDIGDRVKKGALLARLDDTDLQTERSSRLAEMEGARLQLLKAQRNFGRNRQLFEEKLVSQEIFDDSKTEYDLSTNAVDRAEKTLRLVEDRIAKTKILAPFDCTVLTRPVSLGQTVSGAAGFNSGTEIMSIANLSDMIVNSHINQADVTRLHPGQPLDIQVEAVPGLTMGGTIDRIAPQAVIKNGIKGFNVRVVINKIDPRVRPGMTAILSIPVSEAEHVLAVPLAAVFTEPGGERYVFVKRDDKFERRKVVIGVTDYAFAEVLEGLGPGEVVSLEQTVSGTRQGMSGFAARPPARGTSEARGSGPGSATRPSGTAGTSGTGAAGARGSAGGPARPAGS